MRNVKKYVHGQTHHSRPQILQRTHHWAPFLRHSKTFLQCYRLYDHPDTPYAARQRMHRDYKHARFLFYYTRHFFDTLIDPSALIWGDLGGTEIFVMKSFSASIWISIHIVEASNRTNIKSLNHTLIPKCWVIHLAIFIPGHEKKRRSIDFYTNEVNGCVVLSCLVLSFGVLCCVV